MKNWDTLEPDVYRIMNKHYTPGRNGTIDKIVIHHNAGVLSIDQIWQVWQDRAASAHYQVETGGRIGQLVNDWDTAWHAANAGVNATSIGIEVSNSAGAAQDWPIADAAIEEAAHLVAALCRGYKLGRPNAGTNVRFHREFTSTSCPYHLAPGGKYHPRLMDRARFWFDHPAGAPAPAPAPHPKENTAMNAEQSHQLADVTGQITGSPKPGEFPGWPQLGGLTPVDALAVIGAELGLAGFYDPRTRK